MERICGELRLADFDLLELTNLNRIRTGVHNLGLAKVYSVAREIAEIDPFLKVVCFPQGLSEDNLDEFLPMAVISIFWWRNRMVLISKFYRALKPEN